jgi:hypothetical protein
MPRNERHYRFPVHCAPDNKCPKPKTQEHQFERKGELGDFHFFVAPTPQYLCGVTRPWLELHFFS